MRIQLTFLIIFMWYLFVLCEVNAVEGEPNTASDTQSADNSKNKNTSSTTTRTEMTAEEEEEAKRVRRAKIQIERRRDGAQVSRSLLRQGATDGCDWKSQPIRFVKGNVCGSHYKVLGLDRNDPEIDKSKIKKAFRQRSLTVHPDKNPAPEADAAFKMAQSAYDCLSDDECKENYDRKLNEHQQLIAETRRNFKIRILNGITRSASQSYYYVSLGANYIYQLGIDVWNLAGEFDLDVLGTERIPLGRSLLVIALLVKGRMLLQLQAFAYVIMRINYEIAKAHGIL